MIATVTEQLEAAMVNAYGLIENYNDQTLNRAKDSTEYQPVVATLDELIVSIAGALAPVSHLGLKQTGPRFAYDESKHLGHQVKSATDYLRNDATNFLDPTDRLAVLSAFGNTETLAALGRLKGVYSLLIEAVKRQTNEDLIVLAQGDPERLLKAAKRVSHWSNGADI